LTPARAAKSHAGYDTYFLTGKPISNGQKIERAARPAGKTPQQFATTSLANSALVETDCPD